MTATMTDDNSKTANVVVIKTTDNTEATEHSVFKSLKSRVAKKQMVAAATAVTVLAFIIAGILIGVWFYLDAAKQLVQHNFELKTDDNKKVAEKVTADLAENIVQYHTKESDWESWIINDFNRELQVIKSRQQSGYTCYVTPLNRSETATPEFVKNVTQPTGVIETSSGTYYRMLSTAIKDKTMLGTEGQKMCTNVDTYWIQEACLQKQQDTAVAVREKRLGLCSIWSCSLKFVWCCYFKWYCGWKLVWC